MQNGSQKPALPPGFFVAAAEPPPSSQLQNMIGEMTAPYSYSYSNYQQSTAGEAYRQSSIQGMQQHTTTTCIAPTKKRSREEQFFHCDACNVSLDSQSALQAHVASHTKCSQCQFTAAPKVVKAHFESAHGRFSESGFKTVTVAVPGCPVQRFRICVGNDPEDVKQWIEERKRRFPRRQKAEEAKSVSQSPKDQVPSQGVASLLEGYSSSDESDEEAKVKTAVAPSGDAAVSAPTKVSDNAKETVAKKGVCRFFARNGSCRNGDVCAYSHDVIVSPPTNRQQLLIPRDRTKDTLLGKLLSKDLDRERSLTLQLLQYIVDSEFLEQKP
jgi:hypothetical protein